MISSNDLNTDASKDERRVRFLDETTAPKQTFIEIKNVESELPTSSPLTDTNVIENQPQGESSPLEKAVAIPQRKSKRKNRLSRIYYTNMDEDEDYYEKRASYFANAIKGLKKDGMTQQDKMSQETIREMLLFSLLLMAATAGYLASLESASSYYSQSMKRFFMDTPFMKIAPKTNDPEYVQTTIIPSTITTETSTTSRTSTSTRRYDTQHKNKGKALKHDTQTTESITTIKSKNHMNSSSIITNFTESEAEEKEPNESKLTTNANTITTSTEREQDKSTASDDTESTKTMITTSTESEEKKSTPSHDTEPTNTMNTIST